MSDNVLAQVIPQISYIVPLYNERDNIQPLLDVLKEAGEALKATGRSYEVLLVDDGSSDGTVERLKELLPSYPEVRLVAFRKNYGQTAAMSAGFDNARGEIFITLDGDLQNDPRDGLALLEKLEAEELDLVSGWRKHRKDQALTRNFPSWVANRLIANLTQVHLHDTGCSLKVYRADVARTLPLYGEMHRFLPALAAMEGARIAESPVSHQPRLHGYSKYNLMRTFKVILDLMTVVFFRKFLARPLHLFGRVGLILTALGLGLSVYSAAKAFYWWLHPEITGHTFVPISMILGTIFLLVGWLSMGLGLIAELLSRTYFESQGKRPYQIRYRLGF